MTKSCYDQILSVPVPTLVYRHSEHLIAVTELPLDAKGAHASGTERIWS